MTASDILALVKKGISVTTALWENRDLAKQAIDSVTNILDRGKTITQADIDKTEAELDALLAEFNAPQPPERG